MSDPRPILFFDSGVGGLSIVAPARRALPDARFVYAADSAGFPYGVKHESEIAGRVPALLGRLAERYQPRLIVIACNTASTIALAAVRSALDIPIVGTVPAIKPAAALSVTRTIGVLGTAATVRQAYVDDLAARFAGDCQVIRHGSADLVTLAEARLRGEPVGPEVVAAAIAPLLAAPGGDRIDTIVLACTHFPLLEAELATAIGRRVNFVDGGAGIARRIAHLTQGQSFAHALPDEAVFTGAIAPGLEEALAGYGFNRCVHL
ncbi:glutamate racemase [Sphingomonas sp.]|jgi:glutamate racemase|uniref:glutamate racemase n=1 Tax=Sphingomonas sp. TaxID=28214 RepID=UPI00263604AD|nr:glutamate racemase [Sphingomonas sp.]MDF2493985.1 glutamate racemase [Sphingomonas sp.]